MVKRKLKIMICSQSADIPYVYYLFYVALSGIIPPIIYIYPSSFSVVVSYNADKIARYNKMIFVSL
jgi:hypothetical protein